MKIGIIGAMHEEIMELKNSMTNINEVQISNLKFYPEFVSSNYNFI